MCDCRALGFEGVKDMRLSGIGAVYKGFGGYRVHGQCV